MSYSLFLTVFISFLLFPNVPMAMVGECLVQPFLSSVLMCPGASLSSLLGILWLLLFEQGAELQQVSVPVSVSLLFC